MLGQLSTYLRGNGERWQQHDRAFIEKVRSAGFPHPATHHLPRNATHDCPAAFVKAGEANLMNAGACLDLSQLHTPTHSLPLMP